MKNKTALLIIDTQRGFIDPDSDVWSITKSVCIPGVKKVLDIVRGMNLPVYYVKTVHKKDGSTFAPLHLDRGIKFCIEDTESVQIPKLIYPTDDDCIIEKRRFSSFHDTTLHDKLRENSIQTVIITGLAADCCVYLTAGDAAQYGYKVILPYKAISASDCEKYNSGIRFIDSVGYIVEIEELQGLLSENIELPKPGIYLDKSRKWFEEQNDIVAALDEDYRVLIQEDFDKAVNFIVEKINLNLEV